MPKSNLKSRCVKGFSIVEAMIAVLVVAIAILGTMSLRYQSTLDYRRAEVGVSGSRLALMLVETWRGSAGSDTFDPVATFSTDLTIEADDGPDEPSGFILLGKYKIELNNVNYFVTLSYKDINSDLRALNSNVTWEQRGTEETEVEDTDKSFALTIYVEK
ncbi:MAG: hypothetical protein JW804_07100 [Sedimentisphaerales bacterium]|nr:hypothetical protein [Sedimentisphaerales bacterium]